MSLRRLLPTIGLCAFAAALVGACLPWSVAMPWLAEAVSREFARTYGVALTAEGPVGVALLPLPRLEFRRVRLSAGAADGAALAEGGTLALQLSLLALLSGRIDVNTLSLEGTALLLPDRDGDGRWARPAALLAERLATGGASHPRRVSLTRATVTGRDPRDGSRQTARDVDLTLSWPLWSAQVAIAGGFLWNETPTRFSVSDLRLAALLAGQSSPFTATAAWPAGSLAANGTGTIGQSLTLAGRGTLQTRSLPETLTWAGGATAFSPFIETFGLDGRFELLGRTLLLPEVKVAVGDNRLEGAGSVVFAQGRPAVQATLAAEGLNAAPLLAGILRALGLDGSDETSSEWGGRSLALHPFTSGDLDLRLSAGSTRLGPVLMEDVAASLLVRDGSIEVSLNRATVQGAALKGRIGLNAAVADRGETDLKAQGSFDRLDLGGLLIDLGQYRWVLGGAQGQFAFEGTGADLGHLVRHLNGRATLGIDGGMIAGLDLADVVHRNGAVAAGALARRNGRTAFERAGVTLRFTDGIGEIVDGSLKAAALTASLRGRVSLPDRSVQARAEVLPRGAEGTARGATMFEISGPWEAVAVRAPTTGLPEPEAVAGTGSAGGAMRAPSGMRLPAAIRAYAP